MEHVSHRHYSTGFYYGQPGQYYEDARYIREWQVVALVTRCDSGGLAELSLRNKFREGDELELVGPDVPAQTFAAGAMTDADGLPLLEPRTPQMVFHMRLPRPVPAGSILRIHRDLSAKS